MEKLYYPLWYRMSSQDRYLVWYSLYDANDQNKDGIVLDASGKIPIFDSLNALSAYAHTSSITLQGEKPLLHHLGTVENTIRGVAHHPRRNTAIDCKAFLGAWNLFADASRSLNVPFDTDRTRTNRIYDKLFWGTNPPALTPIGRHWSPIWTKRERIIIADILRQGLQTFRDNISYHEGKNNDETIK